MSAHARQGYLGTRLRKGRGMCVVIAYDSAALDEQLATRCVGAPQVDAGVRVAGGRHPAQPGAATTPSDDAVLLVPLGH